MRGYFGGATDYYKAYAVDFNYYDVNSLYPKSMTVLMPFELIKTWHKINHIKLEDFFGFL